jgi:CCR4-NOT transcription complex subunit 9
MPNPHVYGHHQYPQADTSWMHQQNSHQHHAQAAAAAANVAQQQHYNRIASAHNNVNALAANHSQDNSLEASVSEDNRRTLQYIADLLNENTREAALLELSKKREQVPELALILWHSFGKRNRNPWGWMGARHPIRTLPFSFPRHISFCAVCVSAVSTGATPC